MRRPLVLALLTGCILAMQAGSQAAPPPAPDVTISDYRPAQGESVTVWFQWPGPNQLVRIYIDSPRHGLPRVRTSATGHGSTTFRVWSGFAAGTRHYVVLSSSGGLVSVPFTVSPPGVHFDPFADVRTTPGSGEEVFQSDPQRQIGDITRTHLSFTASTVRIVTYYRAIPQAGRKYLYLFTVKTPVLERHILISTQRGNWAGTLMLAKPAGGARLASSAADVPASCPGISYVIQYSHLRSIVNLPLGCLKNPTYLRAGSAFFSSQSNLVESYDDAYDTKSDPIEGNLTLSGPIHR